MRFVDPFSTLQYMGGTITIRVGLFIYSFIIYNYYDFPDKLKERFVLLHREDISLMYQAHLYGVIIIFIYQNIETIMQKIEKRKELRETLQAMSIFFRLLNVFFYTSCVMVMLDHWYAVELLGDDPQTPTKIVRQIKHENPLGVNVDYVRKIIQHEMPSLGDMQVKEIIRNINNIQSYRGLEIYVFFTNAVVIQMYILFCMILKKFKKKCNKSKKLDKNEPFERILMNKDDDVMAKSNFFMNTIMNQMLISCIILYTADSYILNEPLETDEDNNPDTWSNTSIYSLDKKEENGRYLATIVSIYFPEHAITNLLLYVYFFQSTKFDNLFSKKKAWILSIWFFICLVNDLYNFYRIFIVIEEDLQSLNLIFPIAFNLIVNMSHWIRYLAMKFRCSCMKDDLHDFKDEEDMDQTEILEHDLTHRNEDFQEGSNEHPTTFEQFNRQLSKAYHADQLDQIEEKPLSTALNKSISSEKDDIHNEFTAQELKLMKQIYGTCDVDRTLELEEGFYCLTFYGYYIGDLKEESDTTDSMMEQVKMTESFKRQDTKEDKLSYLIRMKEKWQQMSNFQNVYKASFLFLLQMSLLSLIFYAGYEQKFEDMDEEGWVRPVIKENRYKLLLVKLALTMVLHIQLQPQILLCMDKMQYIFRHPENFSSLNVPFMVILMKFIVLLTQELVCMALLSTITNVIDVIANYIAIGVVSEIGMVYYAATKLPLQEQMAKADFHLPITHFHDPNWTEIKLRDGTTRKSNLCNKLNFLIYNIIVFFYRLIYFHSFYLLVFVFIQNNDESLMYVGS